MKISTTKEKLLNAVVLAERIAGKKESLQILSCILLDVGKDISVRATNLEAGIHVHVGGDVGERGIVAVPANVLSQTLHSINSDKINLKTDSNNLLVEARGTKTLIKSVPHEEFPTLTSVEGGKKGIIISRERLIRGIQSVSYAASASMIRPELGSVFVSLQSGAIICVATDSFRLAEKTIPGGAGKQDVEVLIPLKHATELVYTLEHITGDAVNLYIDDSQIIVHADDVEYVSRVIEGNFPNYKEIIPKIVTSEITVLKSDFTETLRKARVFSGNDQHIGLHVYPKRKIFTATAQSADVGEMSDLIDAAFSGEDVDINFHIGYLADCLSSISSDSITFSFSGVGRPLVIRGVSDSSFMYLVMPLNR